MFESISILIGDDYIAKEEVVFPCEDQIDNGDYILHKL